MKKTIVVWDWADRDWCARCGAHPKAWVNGTRCACCRAEWGDPYAKGTCKGSHAPAG